MRRHANTWYTSLSDEERSSFKAACEQFNHIVALSVRFGHGTAIQTKSRGVLLGDVSQGAGDRSNGRYGTVRHNAGCPRKLPVLSYPATPRGTQWRHYGRGRRTAPGITPPGGDTRRKNFVGKFTRIVNKRGRIGKKVRGDTLEGVRHPSEIGLRRRFVFCILNIGRDGVVTDNSDAQTN